MEMEMEIDLGEKLESDEEEEEEEEEEEGGRWWECRTLRKKMQRCCAHLYIAYTSFTKSFPLSLQETKKFQARASSTFQTHCTDKDTDAYTVNHDWAISRSKNLQHLISQCNQVGASISPTFFCWANNFQASGDPRLWRNPALAPQKQST